MLRKIIPRANLRTVCFSKIYPALKQGAIQCGLLVNPPLQSRTLCSASQSAARTTGLFEFETALYRVAPIRAVYRVSHNRPPFAFDFEGGTGVGVKSTYIGFRVERCRFPDFHFPAGADHGIDPIGRLGKV